MAARHEFHEAAITVAVKTIDGDRVVDVQRFQLAVLLDSDEEWLHAGRIIRDQIREMEADDGDSSDTETG